MYQMFKSIKYFSIEIKVFFKFTILFMRTHELPDPDCNYLPKRIKNAVLSAYSKHSALNESIFIAFLYSILNSLILRLTLYKISSKSEL